VVWALGAEPSAIWGRSHPGGLSDAAGLVWWCTAVIPAFRRQRAEYSKSVWAVSPERPKNDKKRYVW
jgi:hypothetical protein